MTRGTTVASRWTVLKHEVVGILPEREGASDLGLLFLTAGLVSPDVAGLAAARSFWRSVFVSVSQAAPWSVPAPASYMGLTLLKGLA